MPDTIDLNDETIQAAIEKAAVARAESMQEKAIKDATTGLLNKRDELLAEKKAFKDKYESLTTKYDFESLDEQLEEAKKVKEAAMTGEERFALKEKEMVTKFSEETKILKETVEKKDKALQKYLIDAQLEQEIAKLDGASHLLKPILRDKIQVVPEGDDYAARIMKNGNPRIGASDGSPMTIGQLVAEYKEDPDYGACFKPSKANGGEANGNDSGNAGANKAPSKRGEMNHKQKADYIQEHGSKKYLALPM